MVWKPDKQWRTEGISTGGCLFQNLQTKLNKKSRKNGIFRVFFVTFAYGSKSGKTWRFEEITIGVFTINTGL